MKIPPQAFYIKFVHCVLVVHFSKYRATLWGYFTHKFVGFDLVGVCLHCGGEKLTLTMPVYTYMYYDSHNAHVYSKLYPHNVAVARARVCVCVCVCVCVSPPPPP